MIKCVGGIKRTAQGAFPGSTADFAAICELAKRDSLFHKGNDQRSLCCFFDAANVSNNIAKKNTSPGIYFATSALAASTVGGSADWGVAYVVCRARCPLLPDRKKKIKKTRRKNFLDSWK